MSHSRERVRYAGLLCLHCIRNLAFNHATGRQLSCHQDLVRGDVVSRIAHQFWLTTVGNFLDIAVLEWCKLFGGKSEKHHWRQIVSQGRQDQFKASLLDRMRMTEDQFVQNRYEMLTYRDKFVSHLDTLPGMRLPHTLPALRGVAHLYHELLDDPATTGFLPDAQPSAARYYRYMYRQAQDEWRIRFRSQ